MGCVCKGNYQAIKNKTLSFAAEWTELKGITE